MINVIPYKVVDGNTIRWFAQGNECQFLIQRKDVVIASIANDAGSVQIVAASVVLDTTAVNDSIYVYASDGTNVIDGIYSITAIGVGVVTINLASTWTGAVVQSYYNYLQTSDRAYEYWAADIVASYFDATGSEIQLGSYKIVPNIKGVIDINIKSMLKVPDIAFAEYDQNASQNGKDLYLSRRVKFLLKTYAPFISGGSFYTTWAYAINMVRAAFTARLSAASPLQYEPNMARYAVVDGGVHLAKFLNTFTKPTYFAGFPFDVSFLWDNGVADGVTLKRFEKEYINSTQISLSQYALTSDKDFVHRTKLQGSYYNSLGGYSNQLKMFLGSDGAGVKDGYVGDLYVDTDYVETTGGSSGAIVPFTEELTIKLKKCNYTVSLYLRWLNSKGGYSYWLFERKYSKGLKTKNSGSIKPFNSDLFNKSRIISLLSKQASEQIVCGADNLTDDDISGLKELLTSPRVDLLINPNTWAIDGAKWQEVIVDDGSFTISREGNTTRQLEVSINVNELIIQNS